MFPLENILGNLECKGLIRIYDSVGNPKITATCASVIPYDVRRCIVTKIEAEGDDIIIYVK